MPNTKPLTEAEREIIKAVLYTKGLQWSLIGDSILENSVIGSDSKNISSQINIGGDLMHRDPVTHNLIAFGLANLDKAKNILPVELTISKKSRELQHQLVSLIK